MSSLEVAELVAQLLANILVEERSMAAPITRDEQTLAERSAVELDRLLQEAQHTAHGLDDAALLQYIRGTSSVRHRLPTWDPLLNTIHEVLVTRYGFERTNSLLAGLNVPRRDTIGKNTGNLP